MTNTRDNLDYSAEKDIETSYTSLARSGANPTAEDIQRLLPSINLKQIQKTLSRLELKRMEEDQIEGDLLQVFSDKLQPVVNDLYLMLRNRTDSRIEETHLNYNKQLQVAEVELSKALTKIDAAQGRIWDTEKQLTEKSLEHKTIAARFEALSHEMDSLRPALSEATTRAEIQQEEIDILNRHIEGHAAEMGALTEETNRYAKLFSDAQEKLSEAEKKTAQLEEQLRNTLKQNTLLDVQRVEAEEKAERNNDGRLEDMMQAVMQLQNQLSDLGAKQ